MIDALLEKRRLLVPAARSRLLWSGAEKATGGQTGLFALAIENTTVDRASAAWIDAARKGKRLRAVFANAHVVNEMSHSAAYRAVVATADRVYADGSGLAVAARLAGRPLADNVNGTDLFPRLAADAQKAGCRMFLLGGAPGVAERARLKMVEFGLGDAIAGTHHGYFAQGSVEEAQAIEAANGSGAEIVLVAMGVPLQDEWIARNQHRLTACVLCGVGGLFDFFAGSIRRAPHAWRVAGLEWVWRLLQEPRRMARRYLVGNAQFLLLALGEGARMRWRDAAAQPFWRRQPARGLVTR